MVPATRFWAVHTKGRTTKEEKVFTSCQFTCFSVYFTLAIGASKNNNIPQYKQYESHSRIRATVNNSQSTKTSFLNWQGVTKNDISYKTRAKRNKKNVLNQFAQKNNYKRGQKMAKRLPNAVFLSFLESMCKCDSKHRPPLELLVSLNFNKFN